MAPSPTIPTSFVPKQPIKGSGRASRSGGNMFLALTLVLMLFVVVSALGVFAYERYLMSVRDGKRVDVETAQSQINSVVVEDFILMRNRFAISRTLLDRHVVATQFFELLENATLQSVRFNSLSFSLLEDRSATIQAVGTARTFNALAAQSSALAGDRRVRRAIFSDIAVNQNGTVSFSLSAELAPSLLSMTTASAGAVPIVSPPTMTEPVFPQDVPAVSPDGSFAPETPVSDIPSDSPATTPL